MSVAAAIPPRARRLWLAAECALLYLVAPVATTWLIQNRALPAQELRGLFAALFALALLLLFLTPGFRWRSLVSGRLVADWRALAIFALTTFVAVFVLTWQLRPGALFGFPLHSTELWGRILVFYALLSVIPQGIIYRALFFARYERLFPSRSVAIAANAVAFGLAHLFFMNWVAILLTTVGGAVFAWAHAEKQSFAFACLLHMLAGWTVFTVGLGRFFYHGAIG